MMSTNDVFAIIVYQMPSHSLRVWAAGDKTSVCVYVCNYMSMYGLRVCVSVCVK